MRVMPMPSATDGSMMSAMREKSSPLRRQKNQPASSAPRMPPYRVSPPSLIITIRSHWPENSDQCVATYASRTPTRLDTRMTKLRS